MVSKHPAKANTAELQCKLEAQGAVWMFSALTLIERLQFLELVA